MTSDARGRSRAEDGLHRALSAPARPATRDRGGLNVVEAWNGTNGVLAYGKRGDIQTNRRDEQELLVLCLRILQAALVYVNTLMLQDILDEPARADILTPAGRRGLTPLFWMHVLPYGEVKPRYELTSGHPLSGRPGHRWSRSNRLTTVDRRKPASAD